MLTLVIGDKDRSSWSLRPWIMLKHMSRHFEEVCLPLDTPRFGEQIGRYSPSRRVPVLLDGATRIWDSLAICEYLNELDGGKAWPDDAPTRAHARAVSAEMHSGFRALRSTWVMRAAARGLQVPLAAEAAADLARIDEIFSDCRAQFGARGSWLFGRYCIADAMYAPVLLRLRTYGAELSPTARSYMDFALEDPHLQEWIRGAEQELAAAAQPGGRD